MNKYSPVLDFLNSLQFPKQKGYDLIHIFPPTSALFDGAILPYSVLKQNPKRRVMATQTSSALG